MRAGHIGWGLLAATGLGACFGAGAGERTSQCEAVCDWAVACHEASRDAAGEALRAACLAATRDASDGCAAAEDGSLTGATARLLDACTNVVRTKAGDLECNAFTGSITEIKTSTPPVACLSLGTSAVDVFEAAKVATAETSAELCPRLAAEMCDATSSCIVDALGGAVPTEVEKELGGLPSELCVAQLADVFVDDCVATDMYAPETRLEELNTSRQAARECIPTLADLECEGLLSTDPQDLIDDLDPLCLGVASSPEDLAAMAAKLLELAQQFDKASQSLP